MISEETLRQMPAEDRAALARSLATVNAELPSLSAAEHRRRRLVLMLTVASAVLIPWIVLLALTLPRHYVAGHWRLTWVGFDITLLAALAATAWFAWRRRQAVVITAFITATLLACDAWFDITTASGQKDTLEAIGSAVLIELPLAALLFWVAYHLLRAAVRRACGLDGHLGEPVRLAAQPLIGVRRLGG
jgi:hypothetical protein